MEEIKVENNNVEANVNAETETQGTGTEIVVEEGGKVKKILKWVVGGLSLVATGIAGFLIGRGTKGGDEEDSDEESASEEAPEE